MITRIECCNYEKIIRIRVRLHSQMGLSQNCGLQAGGSQRPNELPPPTRPPVATPSQAAAYPSTIQVAVLLLALASHHLHCRPPSPDHACHSMARGTASSAGTSPAACARRGRKCTCGSSTDFPTRHVSWSHLPKPPVSLASSMVPPGRMVLAWPDTTGHSWVGTQQELTLLRGSIKILTQGAAGHWPLLSPGQQPLSSAHRCERADWPGSCSFHRYALDDSSGLSWPNHVFPAMKVC